MDKRDTEREERLSRAVAGARFGTPCYAYAACDSTMDLAHELARGGAPEGTLVWAARQRRGRGRLGRVWESPDGGAYFSLILRPTRPSAEAPQLSLVAGLASAEAIHEQLAGRVLPLRDPIRPRRAGLRRRRLRADGDPRSASPAPRPSVSIRWPNDVLVDGKKVAGILAEASVQRAACSVQNYVVVGVGINISTDPRELPENATSLEEAFRLSSTLNAERCTLEPLALVAALCRNLERWYDQWTSLGFAPIRQALRPWMSHMGELVRLQTGAAQTEGQATDLDDAGRLLVRLDSGITRAFDAGEVTLLH